MTNSLAKESTSSRLISVDAYRGFVMLLMLVGGLFLPVAAAFPNSTFWRIVAHHELHVEWVGCSLHDLIQPGFAFLVGMALVLSVDRRTKQGEDAGARTRHAINRAILLVLLGLLISALHHRPFIFDDTLTQIGLAYLPVYFLASRPQRDLWIALGVILMGYWIVFALYPVPNSSFDYAKVGVSHDWLLAHGLHGFQAHWQKNSNAAWAFDMLFLPRLPRDWEFVGLGGGLTTLNFIPLIGTMILGVVGGRVLRNDWLSWIKVKWFTVGGVICLVTGWGFGAIGICPVVKAVWTPSWVLFSGGWCFLFLAAFFVVGEIFQTRRLLFPLVVLGANSLAVYVVHEFQETLANNAVRRIAGPAVLNVFGPTYVTLLNDGAILMLLWLFFYVLYRMRVFVRV